jgi:large subunit ribosomal protein L44e
MKFPKTKKRYCPFCRKHTEHKIVVVSSGHQRGTLKRGSKQRARLRGRNRGFGSHGKYSKPPVTRWKRKTKSTKKTNIIFTCAVCKKSHCQKKGIRTSKIQIEEKAK